MGLRKLLITGAGGKIGSYLRTAFTDRYRLRLADVAHINPSEGQEIVPGDVTNLDQMRRACEGMDTVIHLAAEGKPKAKFNDVLAPNLIGAYNVFQASSESGCRRVVFASSIHAVNGYPHDQSVAWDAPVNPTNLYGVTKCFGEALGRCYASQGLSTICLRLGAVETPATAKTLPPSLQQAWISYRDLAQLVQRCIEVENLDFAILHGLSRHRTPRLDIAHTCKLLGYEPLDGTMA